jgi:hypothetical protein
MSKSSQPDEPTSRLRRAINIISYGLIVPAFALAIVGCFAVLLWALITFAQNVNPDAADCAARETENGFIGNPEFYGFGIRLGIYFQWWASLIANLYLPNEWASLFATFLAFSIALIVVILMLIFQHACTFTGEIIAVLFIFWGGYTGLVYSTKATIAAVIDSKGHSTSVQDYRLL